MTGPRPLPRVPTMNPPKPPPTKKERVSTAANDFRIRAWVAYLMVWCISAALLNPMDLNKVALMIVAYLTGSVVTFTAMKVR